MFLHKDGTVTGSVNWDALRDAVKSRKAEGVSADGWKRLQAMLDEHDGTLQSAEDEAAERAEAAADANAEAGASHPDGSVSSDSSDDSSEKSDGGSAKKAAPAKKAAAKTEREGR